MGCFVLFFFPRGEGRLRKFPRHLCFSREVEGEEPEDTTAFSRLSVLLASLVKLVLLGRSVPALKVGEAREGVGEAGLGPFGTRLGSNGRAGRPSFPPPPPRPLARPGVTCRVTKRRPLLVGDAAGAVAGEKERETRGGGGGGREEHAGLLS